MEKFAYDYAKEKKYTFTEFKYENGTIREGIHMQALFDMFAGTSTGSILSSGLSTANYKMVANKKTYDSPMFWAD